LFFAGGDRVLFLAAQAFLAFEGDFLGGDVARLCRCPGALFQEFRR